MKSNEDNKTWVSNILERNNFLCLKQVYCCLTFVCVYICDSTDVQVDWRRSCICGWAPQRYSHFVGFFNVPIQTPTRGHPLLYDYSEKPSRLVAFYDTLGIRRTHELTMAKAIDDHGGHSWTPWKKSWGQLHRRINMVIDQNCTSLLIFPSYQHTYWSYRIWRLSNKELFFQLSVCQLAHCLVCCHLYTAKLCLQSVNMSPLKTIYGNFASSESIKGSIT